LLIYKRKNGLEILVLILICQPDYLEYSCKYADSRSVSVAWDRTMSGGNGGVIVEEESGISKA